MNSVWSLGRERAVLLLSNYDYTYSEDFSVDPKYTMMNPLGYEIHEDEQEDEPNNEESELLTSNENIKPNQTSSEDEELILKDVSTAEEEINSDEFIEMIASNTNVPSKVVLDGVPVHKSRAINLIINVCPYRQDRDRINRVKNSIDNAPGLINQTEILDANVRLTDFMMTIAKFKDSAISAVIFSINKIIDGNLSISSIDSLQLRQVILNGPVLNLRFKEGNTYVEHDNSYGDKIATFGKNCIKIAGQILVNEDKSRIVFNFTSIKEHIEYLNSLIEKNNEITLKLKKITSAYSNKETYKFFQLIESVACNDSMIRCHICFQEIKQPKLRQHIAKHIINKELSNNANTCGFCGGHSCTISIKVTSGFGKNSNKGISSNCKYFQRFSLKQQKLLQKISLAQIALLNVPLKMWNRTSLILAHSAQLAQSAQFYFLISHIN